MLEDRDNYPQPNSVAKMLASEAMWALEVSGLAPDPESEPDEDVLGGLAFYSFGPKGQFAWVSCMNSGHLGCTLSDSKGSWDIRAVGWPITLMRIRAHLVPTGGES